MKFHKKLIHRIHHTHQKESKIDDVLHSNMEIPMRMISMANIIQSSSKNKNIIDGYKISKIWNM